MLEEQGADQFFGEPAVKLDDFCRTDFSGNGVISLLDATVLTQKSPRLYAVFLLWLLSELYENMPEVGDADKPKLVLFFDEAHLLFEQAPRVLIDKIEQIVRLIRSKGVGVYFISQSPLDFPIEGSLLSDSLLRLSKGEDQHRLLLVDQEVGKVPEKPC